MSNDKNKFDVKHFANLARIDVTDAEVAELEGQMTDILKMVGQLSELDLENVEPTNNAVHLTNVFREDVAGESMPQELAISNFPDVLDESLRTPVIIEDNE